MSMSRKVSVDTGSKQWVQNISVGPHRLETDEADKNGGRDTAPDAEELLLAALGACAATTAQMYAQRKAWALEAVHIDLCFEAADQDRSARVIKLEIAFSGDLSGEQYQRLFEIAGRCPIHRLLASPLEIQSSLG